MDKIRLEQEINLMHNRVCAALDDPKRIMILYLLAEGGRSVNEIADALNMPQPTVSRHLRVLRERGLVKAERKSTSVWYTLADERLIQALDLLRSILLDQLTVERELLSRD